MEQRPNNLWPSYEARTLDMNTVAGAKAAQQRSYQPTQAELEDAMAQRAMTAGRAAGGGESLKVNGDCRFDFNYQGARGAMAAGPAAAKPPMVPGMDLIALRRAMAPRGDQQAMHEALGSYSGQLTAAGAARRLQEYAQMQAAVGISSEVVAQRLAEDPAKLSEVVYGHRGVVACALQMNPDGSLSEAQGLGSTKSAIELVATSADMLTDGYEDQTRIARLRMPPGVFAASRLLLPAPTEYDGDAVYLYANTVETDKQWQAGVAILPSSHYRIATVAEGVPAGIPIATARVCNDSVAGARSAKPWSFTKMGMKNNPITYLIDPTPCWKYTAEGAMELIKYVIIKMNAYAGSTGSAEANMLGASLHHRMQQDHYKHREIDVDVGTLSHADRRSDQ
jgi:hypothetical protein